MSLVVLLRGVNVGGHRTFRPTLLCEQLKHLDAVNIGAAGTFVIRKSITQARLRREFARRLPFVAEIVICRDSEILGIVSRNPLANKRMGRDIVRFVSILSKRPRKDPSLPLSLPSNAKWLLRILGRKGRFIFGLYRRQMKVISYLGSIDRIFGVPATTRNWNTIGAIAKVIRAGE